MNLPLTRRAMATIGIVIGILALVALSTRSVWNPERVPSDAEQLASLPEAVTFSVAILPTLDDSLRP